MQFIAFIMIYPLVWLLSKLPMRILYLKSNVLFFFVFYVFGYRKKVVDYNLQIAFPEKTAIERKAIAKQFFKHFTDLLVETIKAISISKKEILRRYKYKNPELVNNLLEQGKSIVFVSAHQANWEWSVNSPLVLNCNVNGAYTSLGNRYFDRIVKKSRERFGFLCYESSKTVKIIHKNYIKKKQAIYLLISDQSPQLEHTQYWTNFFNVKVPFHVGATSLAKKFDLAVVYCYTKKIKRGYYSTEFKLITDNPKEEQDFGVTEKYISLTEQLIREQPEYYLWSHNRFKHKDRFDEWSQMKSKKTKRKNVLSNS